MEIKVGSKWKEMDSHRIVIVKEFEYEEVIYLYENGSGLSWKQKIDEFLKFHKPIDFKIQEWDIVQCRNKSISIMVDDENEHKLKGVIDTYNLDYVVSNLRNKFISDTDIMKVWRLPDISVKSTLEEQIKNIEPIWVREEEHKTIYDLKDGDRYWCKTTDSLSNYAIWRNSRFDKSRLEVGNIFLTKEDCEFSIEEDKVRAIMRNYACTDKGWLNNDDDKYNVEYFAGNVEIDYYCGFKLSEFLYKTREIAQQVIDEIGVERLLKYYFKVK